MGHSFTKNSESIIILYPCDIHKNAAEEELNCLKLLVIKVAEKVCTLVERLYTHPPTARHHDLLCNYPVLSPNLA